MNRSLRLLLVGALAFAAAGTATTTPAAAQGKNLAQGVKETQNKQTKFAQQQLDKAAATATPDAAKPLYQSALDSANSALKLDAKNPLGHKLAAQALLGLGRVKEAAGELDQAEQLRPIYSLQTEGIREKAWIDQYNLANPLLQSSSYDSAAAILEGANAIYKERPEIMIVLGQIYAQGNEPLKAVPFLQEADSVIKARAADVDSSMAKAWKEQQADIPVTIAQAYITAKDYDKAAATLSSLVDANPTNTMYARSLANVYGQAGKQDQAAAVYIKLLTRNDLTPSDVFQIGIGLYSIDRFADAGQAFKKEAQLAPKDRDAYEMWARSDQLAQNKEGAGDPTPQQLADLAQAGDGWLSLDPNSHVGMLILAQTTNKQKNEAKTNELVARMDSLKIGLNNLQLKRSADGGASLSGEVENYKATQGNPVSLTFTFFDKAGNALGTASTRVPAGPTGELPGKTPFTVDFKSDKQVDGYTYQVSL